jgi:glycosyltransferase involved in cell wall biosynthesis
MRVGLVARAENRGLGILTWEFHRHVQPARTLVVDMGPLARGFRPHLERYPGATVVPFDGAQLPEDEVRAWLEGLDVVYSAETFYDWHLLTWAREAGVATVLHVMPEFYRHAAEQLPAADVVWAPTPWRLDHLPEDTRLVPVPVATDRFGDPPAPTGQLRVLHVAGHRAAGDRNGTLQLAQALRRVRETIRVRVLTQDPRLPPMKVPRNVQLVVEVGGRGDYWQLYDDADVLALPRRYGGLSLPVQEAMAAGLAVVMPDVNPNAWWPTIRVPATARGSLNTPAGPVPLFAASPAHLARRLDHLAANPNALAVARRDALLWSRRHSWHRLLPVYLSELEAAADR